MKITIFTLLIALMASDAYSQVGIGTTFPQTTLQVNGEPNSPFTADGVQVPALTLAQLDAKVAAFGAGQDAALVYINDISIASTTPETADITAKGFYYYDFATDKWKVVGTKADGSETKVTAGTNVNLTGSGTAASPYVVNAQADGSETNVTAGTNVIVTGNGTAVSPYVVNAQADGSETNVTAGTSVTVTGNGTAASPYVVNAQADGSETNVTAGTNVTVTGSGTTASPYVVNAPLSFLTQVQRNALTPVIGLMVYNTTKNKPNIYNGIEWVNFDGTTAMSIGDSHQGGKIFYILQSGDPGYISGETHGLIVAPDDYNVLTWRNGSNTTTGAIGTALGTGQANTTAIVNNQGTGSYAAQFCNDLVSGGYNDWYLPSKDELNILVLNHVLVGDFPGSHWSSTEDGNSNAWIQDFASGDQFSFPKFAGALVRAVRNF